MTNSYFAYFFLKNLPDWVGSKANSIITEGMTGNTDGLVLIERKRQQFRYIVQNMPMRLCICISIHCKKCRLISLTSLQSSWLTCHSNKSPQRSWRRNSKETNDAMIHWYSMLLARIIMKGHDSCIWPGKRPIWHTGPIQNIEPTGSDNDINQNINRQKAVHVYFPYKYT